MSAAKVDGLFAHERERALAQVVVCPRCKRVAVGWPLKRADVCSPAGWVYCLRQPETIQRQGEAATEQARTRARREPIPATCGRCGGPAIIYPDPVPGGTCVCASCSPKPQELAS